MRKFLLLFTALFVIVGAFAKSDVDNIIKFDKSSYVFGKVPKDKPVSVEFAFTNPGKKPLIIEDATAECGCTKPEYPQKPIMPGKTGIIKVTYDAKEKGVFTKKVTVKLVNETESKILTISGEVI
jgi:hypothetical protein